MKRSLIIMPLGLPHDWPADYEVRTARELSRNHTVILLAFGEGQSVRQRVTRPSPVFTRVSRNLYLFRPIYFVPFQRFSLISRMNASLAAGMLSRIIARHASWKRLPRIFWSFSLQYAVFPRQFPHILISVYDCVDAFTSSDAETDRAWRAYERRHLREADVVFVNSNALYSRIRALHPTVIRTGEGLFAQDVFSRASARTEPADLARIPRPRILFSGTINARIDFGYLRRLAGKTPECRYIFIGQTDQQFDGLPETDVKRELRALERLPNVHILGYRPKHRVPAYLFHSDIGLVPYDTRLEFNRYSYPMKIQEFFWYGKPVISTPVGEVSSLRPLVYVCPSAGDAVRTVRMILTYPETADVRVRRKRVAQSNSVRNKVAFATECLARLYPEAL